MDFSLTSKQLVMSTAPSLLGGSAPNFLFRPWINNASDQIFQKVQNDLQKQIWSFSETFQSCFDIAEGAAFFGKPFQRSPKNMRFLFEENLNHFCLHLGSNLSPAAKATAINAAKAKNCFILSNSFTKYSLLLRNELLKVLPELKIIHHLRLMLFNQVD